MPYETPYHLMGWLGPQAALSEFDRLQYNFTPFAIRGQRREAPSWPIWEFAKRINGGRHLPTLKQEIGDCFVAGTLIRMADGTEQPIETVCAGDWVMAPTGQPRQVVDRIVKQFTGELVTLRGKYCPQSITATADHNFVTFPGLRTAAGRTVRHKDRKRDERMAWAACGSLKKTDRVLVPFVLATELSPPTFDLAGLFPYLKADVQHVWAITGATQRCRRYVPFDETLAWLLGMYLAEGGVDRSSKTQRPQRVTFSLSRQEEDLADRIITAIKAVFGVDARKCYLPSKPAVTLVRCAHVAVAGLFKHLIPGNTYAKRIPSWFYGLPENLRVACLRGWFDGDGDGKDGAARATGVSVSQGLVRDAWYLAHSCKLRPAAHTRPPRRRSRESYQVQLYGRDVPVVCSTRPAARAQQAFTDMTRFGRAVPIKTIRREHVTDIPVYCLGVEEEHAFIANGYAVHNCVSFGAAQAGMYMACYEIYRLREEEVYKPWFPPFIYGVSRLAPDCGNGRLGNSDGSLGSWGATAMMKYGVLFADDPGVPPYSGRVAKAWGSRPGPPREFYQEASDNRVGSAAKLTTVEEIREALLNYHTITIASQQGFEMQPVRYRDHHVFKPSGQWSHQMSLLAWQDDPFPAAYRLNCYDDQTEVLTDSGWRRFCDLADQDRVATLNPETHMMEFEYPSARQVYPYHGEMIHFHDQGVDLLVTPNHRMYICPEETNVKRPGGTRQTGVFVDRSDPRNWRIELAETCIRRCAFKKDAKWHGQSPEYYQVGEHRVPMGDWLEFVGLYVAEGYRDTGKPRRRKRRAVATAWTADRGINPRQERTSTRRTYRVCLSQVTPEKVEAIQSLLDQLPWRFKRHGTTWVCHSKSLWRELEVCGDGAPNKRLPLYFRQLSAELLQRLYAGLMLGDGTNCRSATGQDTYYTSSRGLADDVQELLLRIGLAGDIYVTDRRGRVVGKGNGVHRELEYAVGVKRKRLTPAKSNGFPKLRIPYSGNVYCVTTANGIIYVRRNGIACWCGQSWGENAHGAPLNGEPPGGAWNHADDLEKELRRYDVELYALSLFDGFDAAPDFSIL